MNDLLTILPNLSIGVVAVLGMIYLAMKLTAGFLDTLKEMRKSHELAMKEREDALRAVEKEVRTEITTQLISATSALHANTKTMERVLTHFDKH